jgi:RecA-family ATPase
MRTLGRAARRPADSGTFLPDIFPKFAEAGMRLREGTATILAGPPGAMKTALALYWVGRMNLPTLYMSADSEDFEVVERVAAMMSGDTVAQVRANPEKYADQLDSLNMRMTFEDSPTYKDVELEVAAYAEVHGAWPKVIVIDNVMNLVGENESEWAAHRDHMRVVHRLTRITRASVLVLAHMSDDRADTSIPAPRSKLMGKIGALPKLIISLAFDGERLKAAPVKSRWGRADASGQTYVELWVDPARFQLFNSQADFHAGRPA